MRISAFFRNLTRRRQVEEDLRDEVTSYVELSTQRKIREGLDETDARRAALLELGGAEQVKERVREARAGFGLDTFLQDLRYAARSLIKKPGFTITAVIALALGIGANTAIFTLIDQIVLRKLPVSHPEQLVMLYQSVSHMGSNMGGRMHSYPMYQDFQQRAEPLAEVLARRLAAVSVSVDNQTERVEAEMVSGNFFTMLGVKPAIGRVFMRSERGSDAQSKTKSRLLV